jgi:hypothetical protein
MLEQLIQRARRRLILNELLAQTALAAAIFAGGLALVLVLGTAFLAWWTLGFFVVIGLGIGIWQVARHTPDSYKTAVQLDENANLKDAISTALHFSAHPSGSPEFLQSQREQAAVAAGTVNLESAVPFTFPRAVYAMAALCLLATGLVTMRYSTGKGLNLSRPITEVLFEDQAAREVKKPGSQRSTQGQWADATDNLLAKLGLKPEAETPTPGDTDELEKAIEKALQQPGAATGKNSPKGGEAEKGADGKDSPGDDAPGGDPIDGADKNGGDPKDGAGKSDSKKGDASDKANSAKAGEGGEKSLMSKIKDAVNSMLAKSKPEQSGSSPKGSENHNNMAKNDKGEKKGDSNQGKPEKGNADSSAEDSDPNGDALGGQQGDGKESAPSNSSQKQEGSGIGAQDGAKEMHAAEQLKAMGKISEIIGKRSATVSGETSVEVQSGNQQLHTSYSQTKAAHAETDGDVTRDEIPLAVQAYVQQYFMQVRKAAAAKK